MIVRQLRWFRKFGPPYVNQIHSAKKKKTDVRPLGRQRTRVQNFRVYLLKTAWTFGRLCGKSVSFAWSCLWVLSFSIGRHIRLSIGPTQSDLRILREPFGRRALEYLQSGRSEKNVKTKCCFPTETPDHYWPFWRPVAGGDTFLPLAPVLGPGQKNWRCHPLALTVAHLINWLSTPFPPYGPYIIRVCYLSVSLFYGSFHSDCCCSHYYRLAHHNFLCETITFFSCVAPFYYSRN